MTYPIAKNSSRSEIYLMSQANSKGRLFTNKIAIWKETFFLSNDCTQRVNSLKTIDQKVNKLKKALKARKNNTIVYSAVKIGRP